jgi:phage shock protein A
MIDVKALLDPAAAPLWAVFGAVAVKGIDWAISRRKSQEDVTTAAMATLTAAQKQLVDGLFDQIRLLREEIALLHHKLAQAEAEAKRSEEEARKLRREMHSLRTDINNVQVTLAAGQESQD